MTETTVPDDHHESDSTLSTEPRAPKRGRRGMHRIARVGLVVALGICALTLVLSTGLRRVSWLGPLVANSLRAVFGADAVGHLEQLAARVEDRWNRLRRRHEPPKSYWPEPERSAITPSREPPTAPAPAWSSQPAPAPIRPKDIGPLDPKVASPGDGVWADVPDSDDAAKPPLFYKTLIHPDHKRPWTEAFVIAIDLSRSEVHQVAGTVDPESTTPAGKRYVRHGLIPVTEQPRLVVAFNGGFKTEHGHFGMSIDGVTLIPPRPDVCTFAAYRDGSLRIATWRDIESTEAEMAWWRETPPCMVTGSRLHPALQSDDVRTWGAALGGEAIIRRSAVGLNEERNLLFVAIGNYTSAGAIARSVRHAGATDVAQLDVNWSYPKIVVFRGITTANVEGVSLFPGFFYEKGEYLTRASKRDFFYVLRRE